VQIEERRIDCPTFREEECGGKAQHQRTNGRTEPPLLLRATEVAHLLGLGRSKVYEMMQTGELPTVKIGTAVRVPRAALEQWVQRKIAP
jgi:excisionase family DNA binding protein